MTSAGSIGPAVAGAEKALGGGSVGGRGVSSSGAGTLRLRGAGKCGAATVGQ